MEIIEMITAIVSLLIAITTSVIAILTKINAVKNIKRAEKASEHLVQLKVLSDKINEYAIIAEANGGTGEEKKQFVLKSIKAICTKLSWTYDEDWVVNTLELVIQLTKKINNKGAE